MKQLSILLLLLLSQLSATAQDHEATMYFLDGTEVTGFATLKFVKESFYGIPKDKVSFRVTTDDEPDLWDSETISKVVFHDFGTPKTFEFIPVVYIDGTQDSLFEVIATGEVNLYAEAVGVWDVKEDDIKSPEPKHLRVKRKGEKEFAALGNKKKIATYFNQCPGVLEGLEDNTFSNKTIPDIVEYYNEKCGSSKAK
ncbi:hypothetical protein AMR72_17935 [Flavobacterium psychrophilum]|nr:hypothetical protein AMR72_17935 [Flavobacterium psychrophilum]AOE54214.1 hypothetical protein ALW18_17920 [Flavobacterium psychrophilum]